MSIQKGDTIKAKAAGVKCYGGNGGVSYTSTKAGDILGIATGPPEDDGFGRYIVYFIRYSAFAFANIEVLWADDSLVTSETPSTPVVIGQDNPKGEPPAKPGGAAPTAEKDPDGKTVVKRTGLEDLAVEVEKLKKLIESGSPAPAPKAVPVWAWVALGGMFLVGLTLIIVNRNRPVPKRR